MFRIFYVLPLLLLSLLTIVFAQYDTECILPKQEKSGRCVPVKSCKNTYEFLNKILLTNPGGLPTPSEREEISALQCGQTDKGTVKL
ncbi:hypothetical protein DOY81_013237 [Sarcophaga bullata]|nr:hypothetical protein DOY81_013237 [Sarcophaga bullata]